jgi:hypothetical protein
MSQTPNVHVPERRLTFAESTRGVTSRLRDPLPPAVLAAVDAKARRAHAALAERAQKVAADRRRLAGEVAAAPARDADATAEAMRAGKEPPTPTEPKLRDELAEAERLEAAAGEALRRSAVDLLNEAAPKLADVETKLTARAVEDVEAIRGELDRLREHVTALGRTFAEAGWIGTALHAGGRGVPAFVATSSGVGRTLRALSTVADTSAEEIRERSERVASAATWREHEREQAEREWRDRRQREAAERERRKHEREPTAEQAQGRVWSGREPLGG